MIVVMMAVTAALLVMIVVMMAVTAALLVMIVVVMIVLMLFLKRLNGILKGILMLHSLKNILAIKGIPRSCYDYRILIMLAKERNALGDLLISRSLGVGENDAGCIGDLVIIKFAKVLHIHLALIYISNGCKAVKTCIVLLCGLCRADNVRELTNTRGLDNDSIGIILLKHLNKRLGKVAHKRATDTTGVHLGYLDAGIGEKTAVYTDLAKLVFNKYNLLS